MSAGLVLDVGGTCSLLNSVNSNTLVSGLTVWTSGLVTPLSGTIVGQGVNLQNADTFCNIVVGGINSVTSGALRIAVQTAPADVSGQYTDPTSGLAQFPTSFQSGGIIYINSGGLGSGLLNSVTSGQMMQSGFTVAAAFQRVGVFARALVLSGDFYIGDCQVHFVSQNRTTGSGGGYSLLPSSGVVSV